MIIVKLLVRGSGSASPGRIAAWDNGWPEWRSARMPGLSPRRGGLSTAMPGTAAGDIAAASTPAGGWRR